MTRWQEGYTTYHRNEERDEGRWGGEMGTQQAAITYATAAAAVQDNSLTQPSD